jgi:hypothetical protein
LRIEVLHVNTREDGVGSLAVMVAGARAAFGSVETPDETVHSLSAIEMTQFSDTLNSYSKLECKPVTVHVDSAREENDRHP